MKCTEEGKLLLGHARVLEMIARGAPVKQSMTALLELRESMVEGMACSILLLDDDGVHLRHLAGPSLPKSYIESIDGVSIGPQAGSFGTAAYRRKTVVCPDIENDPLWVDYRDTAISHGLRAAWSEPIFDSQQRVLGTFVCYFQTPRQPAADDHEKLQATAQIASIALSRSRDERLQGEREAALNSAQHIARTGSWRLDPTSGRTWLSEEMSRLMGREPTTESASFDTLVEWVHPDDRAMVAEYRSRAIQGRLPERFSLRSNPKNGEVRDFIVRIDSATNEVGDVSVVTGTMTDVTEEMRASEERAANAARLALAIRSANVGLWDWDLKTNRAYFSPEWKQQLGFGEHELNGDFEAWRSRLHPADAARMLKQVKDYIANPHPGYHTEFRLRHRDGSYRWIYTEAAVVKDDEGEPVRMLGSHIDVTERRKHEQDLKEFAQRYQAVSRRLLEAEALERKRLARELHDRVGQSLSLLMMNLALLRSALPEPHSDAVVHRLDDSEQLLSKALKEVRTVMADLRPAELDDFGLTKALKFHAEAAGRRSGFSVRFHGADPVVPLPIGVETAVYRIALEALTNISKHADATKVSIALSDDAECVTLTIRDNGRGISGSAPDATDHRGIRGMRERAQSMSASLTVQDAPAGGTCVTLRVPRVVDDPPAGTQSGHSEAGEEGADV
jgi:two-component system sensor histidine kinase UhpB